MNEKDYETVFVYGTLKTGFRNHSYMEKDGIQYLTQVKTKEKVPLFMDPQERFRPCLVDCPGIGHHVTGELYKVSTNEIESLDKFERVPNHYLRKKLVVRDDSGVEYEANTYFNVKKDLGKRLLKDYTKKDHDLYCKRTD
eukprot:GHVL01013642.1.p1 GENE.GHVL01013642.1~~GHVL01013642.1.p1  ORF type:complete len:140 (-),score=18.93 GHVL01013642.1:32-451(-)